MARQGLPLRVELIHVPSTAPVRILIKGLALGLALGLASGPAGLLSRGAPAKPAPAATPAPPASAPAAKPALPADVLSFDQVRTGMKGSGRTVLHGDRAESFDAEILGKLERIGPGQNLIIAKLTSPVLAETGVLEGMSGSPVYVDGKMVGAIAYSWGFAREAVAGITPIEEMIAIPDAPASGGRSSAAPAVRVLPGSAGTRMDLLDPARAGARFDAILARFTRGQAASAFPPLGLPVSVSGVSASWLSSRLPDSGGGALRIRVGGGRSADGAVSAAAGASFTAASAPSGGAGAPSTPGLAAGDAVGAQLVRGDIDFTAFGTVTRVSGDRVLAFGHPFLQLGPVDFPMTRARVETLLPSLASSFKMMAPTDVVGAFRQDRASGLSGRLGTTARMVPVKLTLQSEGRPSRTFSYEVVSEPVLTPVLLYLTIGGVLETVEKSAGDASIQLLDGSVLVLDAERKADVSNFFAGEDAVLEASASVGVIADALLRNEHEPVQLQSVDLTIRFSDGPRQARITGAWTDRAQVRAGERLILTVGLKPYREQESQETIPIDIPKELEPGRFTLHIGDARTVTRIEQSGTDGLLPLDLDNLLDLVNTLRKNQSLAILGTREEPSILIGSEPFPNLPPSKSSMILRKDSRGTFPVLRTRPILDETRDTDYEIEGYRKVEVEVVH